MRFYIGEHTAEGPTVWVVERAADLTDRIDDTESLSKGTRLVPRGAHSADGFDWSYAGDGPADLALSILQAELGEVPPPAVYIPFRDDVVAHLHFYSFELPASQVWEWIGANRRLIETELFEKLPRPEPEYEVEAEAKVDGPALAVTAAESMEVTADTAPTASALVAACESAWSDIRRENPDLPEVVIVLGSGVERGRLVKLGHWWGGRWVADGETRGEVLLAGEALHLPPEKVFEVLLHEAAHGINAARGIRDTSRGGRYHNQSFKAAAEEVGLEVRAMRPHGLAATDLGTDAEKRYGSTIVQLGEAMRIARQLDVRVGAGLETEAGHETDGSGDGRAKGSKAATCGCGRRIRMAPSVLAVGPVICGVCGADFTVVEPYMSTSREPWTAERSAAIADGALVPRRQAALDSPSTTADDAAVLSTLERRRAVVEAAPGRAATADRDGLTTAGLTELRDRLADGTAERHGDGRSRTGRVLDAPLTDARAAGERITQALLQTGNNRMGGAVVGGAREVEAGGRRVGRSDREAEPWLGALDEVESVDPEGGATGVDVSTLGRVRQRLEDSLAQMLRSDEPARARTVKAQDVAMETERMDPGVEL